MQQTRQEELKMKQRCSELNSQHTEHNTEYNILSWDRSTCNFKAWWAWVEAGSLTTWQKTEDRCFQVRSPIDGSPVRREMSAFQTRSCNLIYGILCW